MNRPISRRRFLKHSLAAAAAAGAAPGLSFTAKSYAQIVGSNEDVRVGVVGFNQRGRSHIDAFRVMPGVRLVALCDADAAVLNREYDRLMNASDDVLEGEPTTRPATRSGKSKGASTKGASTKVASTKPATTRAKVAAAHAPLTIARYADVRKLLESKEVDAISTATPNHWHALIAIWACQAGKDVYVEKPVSHNVWEGRKIVEAARKYNRIVQTGTQARSLLAVREALEWVRAGNVGKIQVARGLCYKPRASIGKTEGPQPVPGTVDYDLWCGPAEQRPPRRKQFHYDWHWFWETGNGDLGNQGLHQMDIARWALGKNELAPKIISVGGRLGYDDDGETPNTMFVIHDYGDCLLIFEVRGLPSEPGGKMDKYHGQDTGQVIECEGGYLAGTVAYDNDDKEVRTFAAPVKSHFENFIDAVRSRRREDLHADIEQGHLSSALCHTANISYRLGKLADPADLHDALKDDKAATETLERFEAHLDANGVDLKLDKATLGAFLQLDPKTERFIDNEAANAMLTREYRKPFVVPEDV